MKGKHLWLMLACCLIPIAALVVVFVFHIPLGTVGTLALFLLCPLMHLFMMRGMGHDTHHSTTADDKQPTDVK